MTPTLKERISAAYQKTSATQSWRLAHKAGYRAGLRDELVKGLREALEHAATHSRCPIIGGKAHRALTAYDEAMKELEKEG